MKGRLGNVLIWNSAWYDLFKQKQEWKLSHTTRPQKFLEASGIIAFLYFIFIINHSKYFPKWNLVPLEIKNYHLFL